MIIVEYTLDHPILKYTRTTLPEIKITVEDSYTSADGKRLFIARINYDDFEAVEAALAADSTVTNPERIATSPDHQHYRLTLAGHGVETDIRPLVIELGGVQLHLVGTSEGWKNRTQLPDREAFEQIYQFCVEHDIGVTFHRIWQESETGTTALIQLTDAQREALATAADCGYLEIPRQCSLAEFAAELGISESAASERFRRAVKKIINQAVEY